MPRFAMIQTPVLSLPCRLFDLVAGARLDELAEASSRELVVRERLGQNVPSAASARRSPARRPTRLPGPGMGRCSGPTPWRRTTISGSV